MADNRPGFVCLACMAYHDPPQCDHDAEQRCLCGCGRKRGDRWTTDGLAPAPRWMAWACWWTSVLGNPPIPAMGGGNAEASKCGIMHQAPPQAGSVADRQHPGNPAVVAPDA